jgi:hypothetical protein
LRLRMSKLIGWRVRQLAARKLYHPARTFASGRDAFRIEANYARHLHPARATSERIAAMVFA